MSMTPEEYIDDEIMNLLFEDLDNALDNELQYQMEEKKISLKKMNEYFEKYFYSKAFNMNMTIKKNK